MYVDKEVQEQFIAHRILVLGVCGVSHPSLQVICQF